MRTVTKAEIVEGFTLRLTFDNGFTGDVVVDPRNRGPMFEPLLDPEYFRQVAVSEDLGTVAWPNGLDLAPETLYARACEHPVITAQAG